MSLAAPGPDDYRIIKMSLARFFTIGKEQYPQDMIDIYGGFGDPWSVIESLVGNSATYALLKPASSGDNETTLGFMGVQLMWPGVGRMWAVTLEPGQGHGLALVLACRHMVEKVAASWGLHRVEITLMRDKVWSRRVAKALRFEVEADKMARYSTTRDDYMLAARNF